ncbi:putative Peptidase M16 domain protein [Candidatus Sulfopaludibacter sp. SbA3]|nr:putative Peptidase M16 domain protein [Candidatus Sulfopaludibacter sp. SbA3]
MLQKSIAALALSALSLCAQNVDRTKAPATPPIPSYKLPPVFQTKLPNGLAIEIVEDARFPLVTARVNFMAGSKFDPAAMPGLAEAVATLLNEGTKTRSSRQISEETDAIGGGLGASAGPDSLTVVGNSLSENLPKMLDLVADITLNANFPQNEVSLYQQNRIQSLRQEHSQSSFLAAEKMAQVAYGSSPYAHIGPTAEAVQKLDPKTLTQFRDTYLVPNNATLILIGKLPARAELMALLTKQFGVWQQKPLPPATRIEPPAPHRQIVLVDRPGSVQADIHVGRLAPIRTTSEYFPLTVGNNILGGGTNSRMFQDIREREGFAYDAHSEYATNREAATLSAVTEVRNEVIEPALKAVLAEMDKLATTKVEAEELTNVKNYMAGLYLLRLETQDGLATQLNNMKTLGLPDNYLETYTTRVRSVEPDQILAVGAKYLATGQAAIVVVGDASKIADALKKFGDVTIAKAN